MYWDTFGGRMKSARERAGIKQKDLAEALGKSQTAISNYEIGKNEPPRKVVGDIAAALGVTTAYLLGVPDVESRDDPGVMYVPMVGSLDPKLSRLDASDNILTKIPLPIALGTGVVAFRVPSETNSVSTETLVLIAVGKSPTLMDEVVLWENGRCYVCPMNTIPPSLLRHSVGVVVGRLKLGG